MLAFVFACRFEPGVLAPDDAPTPADAPIDARVPDAKPDARMCPNAPAGCALFTCAGSASCYYHCGTTNQTKATWPGARDACTNSGLGCIVTIDDQAEQDCITAATMPAYPNALVWFGFRQDPGADEPAGGWAWECPGSSYVQPGWGIFEPNDFGGNEDCAAMTNFGGWFDANCSGTATFVCELP